MAGTSVDGLVSGMNTSAIISQLMELEARPQTALRSKVGKEQSALTAYQAINATLKTVLDKARGLDTAADWKVYTAASSAASVAVTASSTAQPGNYTFDVTALAKQHTVLYATAAAQTTVVAPSGSISVTNTSTGTSTNVSVGDGSLQSVVNAINGASGLGVRAGLIQTGANAYRLQLTSTSTGAAAQFSVSGLDATALGSGDVTSTGQDAAIQIGPNAATDTVRSATNTFTGVFPGVTFTVTKPETGVTVTVGTDNAGLADRIKGLVDAVNASLNEIAKDTAYNATTKAGGPLLGQRLPTQLQGSLLGTVNAPTTGTLSDVGIQLDRGGKLVLDQAKLTAALAADPAKVQSLVTDFAGRLITVADGATQAGGTVTSIIESRQSAIRNLNDQISDWNDRLALRKQTLQRQYSTLETTLGRLQSQSSWLAGQIASLGSAS